MQICIAWKRAKVDHIKNIEISNTQLCNFFPFLTTYQIKKV